MSWGVRSFPQLQTSEIPTTSLVITLIFIQLPSMNTIRRSRLALLMLPAALACSAAAQPAHTMPDTHADMDHAAMGHDMGLEVVIPAGALYTAADVHFMQGMIAHHAQAIHMSRLAATRTSNDRLLRFAQKIDQSQEAEIRLMQGWLFDHQQGVPDTSSYRTMMMAGMLTPEQLETLAAASGAQFDRLYLELMIKHHEGALGMVSDLLAAPGAAQEVDVSVLANEVDLAQKAEIDLMHQMLANLEGESP